MPHRDLIVIGASAGGVEALTRLAPLLSPDLEAAICVVMHFPADATSYLPTILNRHGSVPAQHAVEGAPLLPGRIYVGPPGNHLILEEGRMHLSRGPHENRHRPSIDPLFRSAARAYGRRVIGVVLSGTLEDGAAGLAAIHTGGGVCLVQDPDDALYQAMPRNALSLVDVDDVLPIPELGEALCRLVREDIASSSAPEGEQEPDSILITDPDEVSGIAADPPGTTSGYTCPDCGGALWEYAQRRLVQYRCRTGHRFSAGALLAAQGEALESALWIALRTLEESASLSRRLATRAESNSLSTLMLQFEQRAGVAEERARVIRAVLYGAVEQREIGHGA